MRYRDIPQAGPDAQANAQRTQRDKLVAVNDRVARASQTHQNTVKAAHDGAAAAKAQTGRITNATSPPKPAPPSGAAKMIDHTPTDPFAKPRRQHPRARGFNHDQRSSI
jgi:hypothetical protein